MIGDTPRPSDRRSSRAEFLREELGARRRAEPELPPGRVRKRHGSVGVDSHPADRIDHPSTVVRAGIGGKHLDRFPVALELTSPVSNAVSCLPTSDSGETYKTSAWSRGSTTSCGTSGGTTTIGPLRDITTDRHTRCASVHDDLRRTVRMQIAGPNRPTDE